MQPRRPVQRFTRALAVSVITAAAVAGVPTAGAQAATIPAAVVAPCVAWTSGQQPPDPGGTSHNNALRGVAVLSPCNAWAVGEYDPEQTLIVHWDGKSWTQVPSPNPGIEARLFGVHALSASNIWAVGEYLEGTTDKTLIVHWDGTAWTQVPSPNVSGASQNALTAIRGISATDLWAVGSFVNGNNVSQTLILHWNGTAWKVVPSPDPSGPTLDQILYGVAGVSAQDAWAVGVAYNGVADKTLLVHWDGSAWKQVKSPNPGGAAQNNDLDAIAVTSANDAWAAGEYGNSGNIRTLVLHWDGSAWQQVTTPTLGGPVISDTLTGIGASSAGNVWTVGHYYNGTAEQTLALHCC